MSASGSETASADVRADRVQKYKEERRRQLALNISNRTSTSQPTSSSPRRFITRAKSATPGAQCTPSSNRTPSGGGDNNSSGSDCVTVRTTRASRLRAARVGLNDGPSSPNSGSNSLPRKSLLKGVKEKSPLTTSTDNSLGSRLRPEKDKSSKRKSNLNRSLNTEEIATTDLQDDSNVTRRRRRRVLNTSDILTSLNESGLSSGSASNSARVTPLPSPLTAPSRTPAAKKSELSIHMENARRGVTASSVSTPKKGFTCIPRVKSDTERRTSSFTSEYEEYYSLSDKGYRSRGTPERKANFGEDKNLKSKRLSGELEKDGRFKVNSDNEQSNKLKVLGDKKVSVTSASRMTDISKRLDEVTACTKETLARVERLTNRSQQSPKRDLIDIRKKSSSNSPEKQVGKFSSIDNDLSNKKANNSGAGSRSQNALIDLEHQKHNGYFDDILKPSSILKKKPQDEPVVLPTPPASVHIQGPISILKRKSSQDEAGSSTSASSVATPPVTFSPNVVEHSCRKPGILKKRSSLDENHVIRRRSYSPDVALVEGSSDCRPILKNQRRSSLEEIIRIRSPDIQPQGILKRKYSRGEEDYSERSLGSPEPQSILKRRSGTSSSGSSGNSPHVSIATAVILAAAGGAEIILEPSEIVKPILKKKSISEENSLMDSLNPDVPKPILKKKSSTETDDQDDKPMKPILKTSRKCSQDENYSSRDSQDYSIDSPRFHSLRRNRSNYNSGESSSECEAAVRPILKQSSSRENSPRPRLSFCNNEEITNILNRSTSPHFLEPTKKTTNVRRSNTVAADSNLSKILNLRRSSFQNETKDEHSPQKEEIPQRPVSVFEMVMNFEKSSEINSSTGAIPKKSNLKGSRNSGRFRTQPITFQELEATQRLETVQSFQSRSEASVNTESFSEQQLSPHREQNSSGDLSHSLDLTCSTVSSNNDSQLTTPSSIPNESADSGLASKMSFANDDDDKVESPQELCRSNSVSAKASIFKQLEAQMKAVAEEAKNVRLGKGGNKGVQRYRNRKQASSTSSLSENRFSTQPVTLDEVQEAFKVKQLTVEPSEEKTISTADDSEEPDPSKLSLAERVKLFNQKITQERLPIAPGGGPGGGIVRKPRHARFKTQPVTTEEVETAQAQRISPLAASLVKPPDAETLEGLSIRAAKDKIFEHAAKILTSEVRGILKSKSAISPVPTNDLSSGEAKSQIRTIFRKDSLKTNGHSKSESSEDEGVSTEETSSGSDNIYMDNKSNKTDRKIRDRDSSNEKENRDDIEALNKKNRDLSENLRLKVDECVNELKVRRHLEEVQQMSSSTEGTPQTSDGESSGGREVKKIISNEAVARRRQAAINRQKEKNGQLTKSKSQSSISRLSLPGRQVQQPVQLTTDVPSVESASFVRGGVRRSLTLPVRPTAEMPGGATIADRLAELQHSGNNEWRKRLPKLNTANDELIQLNSIVTRNLYNESLSAESVEKTSILAARKDKLDAASQQWKKRVETSDAVNFSVAGRMYQNSQELPASPLTVAALDKTKRVPKAERFKGKEGTPKITVSTPVSPEKDAQIKFKRSISAPGVADEDASSDNEQCVSKTEGRRVVVPRPDDETFTTFFESVTKSSSQSEHLDITKDDLDIVSRQCGDLLVTKRTVRVQRKHAGTNKNPIKALAARTDIKEEYTEVITGVAEREKRRLNVEKLAKHSSMAIEALAGLASKEDFTAVSLKKGSSTSNAALLPYKDLMLLHIKGRRHIQTRLVEPTAASINKGDNYVLVTPTQVYNYVGVYSNIIEQSRGAEIALHIQQKKDLGCKCNDVITIHEGKGKHTKSQLETFWKLLGATPNVEVTEAGHPDEDEIYESAIIGTNMIYELDDNELVPVEAYWGCVPKIEILNSSKVLVFDFGSEMYIWSGRNVSLEQRKEAVKLAKEMWENGYNYSDCAVCPVNAVSLLGRKKFSNVEKKSNVRPDWALICKLTQHGETILFREKFLDWPDFNRVIKVKNSAEKTVDASIILKPCNADEMHKINSPLPDLILEGSHLGRGTYFYDEETNRYFEISTLGVTVWHVLEYEYEQLPPQSLGMFYSGDSYVIRWQYMYTVTGRELSGKPSKHLTSGRDRCAYFCWQGKDAPLNDKGAAALLTVELDHERGPQVRVTQGSEPPAFLNLFKGLMTVHLGRRENNDEPNQNWRLFMCLGDLENETRLIEVPCSMRHLRSRTSFLLLNLSKSSIIVWHGTKSSKSHRNLTLAVAKKLKSVKPKEFDLVGNINISETEEGAENDEFQEALDSGNRQLYYSLLKDYHSFNFTPRMFHLSSISGDFKANEVICHYKSDQVTPYPFIQSDLYAASQPALFLIDNGHELWLWQGWWPEMDSESDSDSDRSHSDQTGSGQHRWQAERRAAMQTILDYWQGPANKSVPAFLVWAGLEPLEFTNLFPTWTDRDDIAEVNIKDGRKPGEILRVETELARLTQSTYPLSQLLQRPLPEGVDPTQLENYLSAEDFESLLGMTKPDFQKLPTWKQTNIKKENGLF